MKYFKWFLALCVIVCTVVYFSTTYWKRVFSTERSPRSNNQTVKGLIESDSSSNKLLHAEESRYRSLHGSSHGVRTIHGNNSDTRQLHGNNSKIPLFIKEHLNLRHRDGNVPTVTKTSSDPVNDYYRFPCIRQLEGNKGGPCVRTLCGDKACGNILDNCTQANLKILKNAPICTYDLRTDFIAKEIRATGDWERDLLHNMMIVLKANPGMVLVDIGCNIGVYTLVAAWMSRRVICIDANYENLRMVNTSLAINNLTENVTLIWNALSSEIGETTLKIMKNNNGASRLEDIQHSLFTVLRRIRTQIITLDQLLPLIKGKPVFMKMDIEGYELNALKGGEEFLRTVDIRYIQMELWPYERNSRPKTARMLAEYGFLPFEDIAGRKWINEGNLRIIRNLDIYYIHRKQL